MANSDYVLRSGGFGFCPMAFLAGNLAPLDTALTITGYTSPIDPGIRLGMAAMIGDEIVSVIAQSGNNLTLGRGCCDTVPVAHSTGDPIWFFDDSIGRDKVEYAGGETIGVKVLPRTISGGPIPIEHAPAVTLLMGFRFFKPYPPGLVKINGLPFTANPTLNVSAPDLVLTWAHRDRVLQQDQLVDHMAASVGPEAGTTYEVDVYNDADTLMASYTGLTGTTWTYTLVMASADFNQAFGDHPGYLRLASRRDGVKSFQDYRVPFLLELPLQPYGLGYRLGEKLGTNTP